MTSTSPAPARARPGRRGRRTAAGKARAARNALKHGMRAAKYVVLPDEDVAEFAALEAALIEELAPVGALQNMLARRVAVAAWRLARADRIEADLFAERHIAGGSLGLAVIRDGNGTRSFETLLRYRGAAMAEFWRALRTLKALQAEQAAEAGPALEALPLDAYPKAQPTRPAARPPLAHRPQPDEPERNPEPRLEYVSTEPPARGRTLHEPAARWLPNEPDTGPGRHAASPLTPPRPERTRSAPRPTT